MSNDATQLIDSDIRVEQFAAELLFVEQGPIGARTSHELFLNTPNLLKAADKKFGPRKKGDDSTDRVWHLLSRAAKNVHRYARGNEKWNPVSPLAVQYLYGLTDGTRTANKSERARLMSACYAPEVPFATARGIAFKRLHRNAMLATLIATLDEREPDLPPGPDGVPRPAIAERIWEAYKSTRSAGGGFILVWGPSGYGKSVLAQQTAHRVGTPGLVATIRASLDPALMAADIALALEKEGATETAVALEDDVIERFRHTTFKHLRLIVVDNVSSIDQLRLLFPFPPTVPVLVTSQFEFRGERDERYQLDDARKVEVGPLTLAEGTALVHALVPDLPDQSVQDLHRLLSGHPLCLDQAARYLSQNRLHEADGLIEDLQREPNEALRAVSEILQVPNGLLLLYERSLAELTEQWVPTKLLMVLTWQSLDVGISRQAARVLTSGQAREAVVDHRFEAALSVLYRAGFVHIVSQDLIAMHDLARAIIMNLSLRMEDSERAIPATWDSWVDTPQPWDRQSDWLAVRGKLSELEHRIVYANFGRDSPTLRALDLRHLLWAFWVFLFLERDDVSTTNWRGVPVLINVYQGRVYGLTTSAKHWRPLSPEGSKAVEAVTQELQAATQRLFKVDGASIEMKGDAYRWEIDYQRARFEIGRVEDLFIA